MHTYADKIQESKSKAVENTVAQKKGYAKQGLSFVDNRPEGVAQRKLQKQADNHSVAQQHPVQKKENKTGLSDHLKTGMENLSGVSLDHVKVHYNSSKPGAVQAHAYAQGSQIHVASGQEKHVPHEAWHVVQQMQGRVKPTTSVNGIAVNDNKALEREADVMGDRALRSS